MPATQQILDGLTRIANDAFALAVLWHAFIAIAMLALCFGWRPTRRTARVVIAMPSISAASLAFVFENPFNGTVFTVLFIALLAVSLRLGTERVQAARNRWVCSVRSW